MPIHGVTNLCSQTEAVEFANDVAELWKQQLGQRLVGVYLIGSLAHGGFNARYSDIDMALIAEVPLEASEISSVNREAAERSPSCFSRLSLFWADQDFSVGRFPPLDLISRALFCRSQERDPRSLFSERSKLFHLRDRCKDLIGLR